MSYNPEKALIIQSDQAKPATSWSAEGRRCAIAPYSLTSVRQWRRELLDKTDLTSEQIAEYSGEQKATAPVTLATYQILTYRPHKEADFSHFSLFQARSWGLIIYGAPLTCPHFPNYRRITSQTTFRTNGYPDP